MLAGSGRSQGISPPPLSACRGMDQQLPDRSKWFGVSIAGMRRSTGAAGGDCKGGLLPACLRA